LELYTYIAQTSLISTKCYEISNRSGIILTIQKILILFINESSFLFKNFIKFKEWTHQFYSLCNVNYQVGLKNRIITFETIILNSIFIQSLFIGGFVADYLVGKRIINKTLLRKIFESIGEQNI
jgi:hypothetical protein